MKEITSKINRLKRLNIYDFYPPVDLKLVEEFEEYHNIELPIFYKKFITQVCNGIIFKKKYNNSIEDILINFDFNTRDDINDKNLSLHKEFPLKEAEMNLSRSEYMYFDVLNGAIQILSTGCGNGQLLIVKGYCKGQIWIDEIMSNDEIYPDKLNKDFELWINYQIDKQIESRTNNNFFKKIINFFN